MFESGSLRDQDQSPQGSRGGRALDRRTHWIRSCCSSLDGCRAALNLYRGGYRLGYPAGRRADTDADLNAGQ